jgi:hypothetical protein
MRTIRAIVSRIKNLVKGVKQDAFLTDRLVYALLLKHARFLMRRQDAQNKIMRLNSIFQTLAFVELIEVDKVQAGCMGLSSDCTIKRTREPIPDCIDGYWGPLIRSVTSIDGAEYFVPTYPTVYTNIAKQKNFRYNFSKYYWYIDGYLYFPDLVWDAVKVEGVFEEDISKYNCDCDDDCRQRQDQTFTIPEFLDAELDKLVLQELGMMLQIPPDVIDDKQSNLR